LLGLLQVLDPGEAVIVAVVRQSRGVHLPGQPLPTVEINSQVEREPGLEPHVHEAEDRVDQVMVDVLALEVGQHSQSAAEAKAVPPADRPGDTVGVLL